MFFRTQSFLHALSKTLLLSLVATSTLSKAQASENNLAKGLQSLETQTQKTSTQNNKRVVFQKMLKTKHIIKDNLALMAPNSSMAG